MDLFILNYLLFWDQQKKFTYVYIGPVVECSPMGRQTGVQSQVESYQRLKKMVLDTSLLNSQDYKVRFKSKVEQSRERSSALPYTSV